MMKYFLYPLILFLICSVSQNGFGQTTLDHSSYDFGTLNSYNEFFTDFIIRNKGQKKEYILRVQTGKELTYKISSDVIYPDSFLILRVQINPSKLGKFNYELPVFFSDKKDPSIIRISGMLKEFPENAQAFLTNCPDFSAKPSSSVTDFGLTVITIDEDTKKELPFTNVTLLQNGNITGKYTTNKSGSFKEKISLGYTYFLAEHDGYISNEFGTYINFNRNKIIIPLKKNVEEDPILIAETKQPEPVSDPEIIIPEHLPDPPSPENNLRVIKREFDSIPFEDFSPDLFQPVNVVFVLDVSSSMLVGERAELMKHSLYKLIEYLRPDDKMGIVTYATASSILMPSAYLSSVNKKDLKKMVEKVKIGGSTSGGLGIKQGFEQASKAHIADGANMVIIITDGAFNKNSDNYIELIQKYQSQNITMSVVGIKNSSNDKQKMIEAATAGKGSYIPIFRLKDAQLNLIQEIRKASFKGK